MIDLHNYSTSSDRYTIPALVALSKWANARVIESALFWTCCPTTEIVIIARTFVNISRVYMVDWYSVELWNNTELILQ